VHQSGHPSRSRPPATNGRGRSGRPGLQKTPQRGWPQVPHGPAAPPVTATSPPAHVLPARGPDGQHAAAWLEQQQP